ncbi:MAG TPA: chromosomal replication initiator protein DnaA [Candidatus Thiothrix moscowensis]|uniref:chromosomal replication initiator protein DnaA n=1 Tax=unclassified Thiothrix TaxID=2636184 RepID=UPI001A1ADD01|nr:MULTISPECIES: chromosomal replication initiator protein DnaA [unclassified Thiothrix]MBJ6611501.1 chromosomal replication initiator protein DnaA [Candidatus Thiothrix moscowensis]HRJ51924.1 chromosomal replication initiator protein DnaA [Candidatus Thiothrix moscowensis]HRJ92239.1 chromosomal replication initiator protein DnaA [Candidatus Thiothrix moscowensis]
MLWQQCLQQLEQEVPDHEISTWLRSLHAIEKRNAMYLLAPNTIVLQQVHENYLPRILFHARIISGDNAFDVLLQIGSSSQMQPQAQQEAPKPPILNNQLHTFVPTPAPASERFANALNPRMTFANFVEGKSNSLACAAAQQVGDNPDTSYNPLFIYGGVGLGKTHLMHAIGNRVLEHNPNARVIYVYAERFVNDMISAIRSNRMEEFKLHYRSADALLIDDIQFFAGKDRSMEEFFHTFNALLEGQKRIILASDKFPKDLEGIEDRLKTRFNWGLTVQIESPDLETRVAILRKKAEDAGLRLPNDVSFFIGKRFHSNIRDLEGALQRVIASMRLKCITQVTMDFVQDALRDQLASQDKLVSIANIKKAVAQYYNIRVNDLDSKSRTRSLARPRQIAMALTKELTNHSLPEIGEEFGGRDHTTVLHACRKVVELRESTPKLDEEYRILLRTLTS